jgi:tetratricopeptide (TPR) repeat protein
MNKITRTDNIGQIMTSSSIITQKLEKDETGIESTLNNDKIDLKTGRSDEPQTPKKWTILHYTAGDNNLKKYLEKNVNEMEAVGSTNTMNIVSLFDKGDNDCKLYHIQKDDDPGKITSPVLKDYGNTNMADPEVLKGFLVSMMEKFPAENYCLVIGDHGGGWRGAIEDQGSRGWMKMPEMRQAIEEAEKITGKKLSIISFDACQMATGEVAYELKDTAKYLVACQENEGGSGWPYLPLLSEKKLRDLDKALQSRLDITPEDFAKKMVSMAKDVPNSLPTLAAIDLTQMDKYKDAVNTFAQAIMDSKEPFSIYDGLGWVNNSFNRFEARDQYHFIEQIAKNAELKDENLRKSAQDLMKTIKGVVVEEWHSNTCPYANGLNIEVPVTGMEDMMVYSYTSDNSEVREPRPSIMDPYYKDLLFAKETKWDEAMEYLWIKAKTS